MDKGLMMAISPSHKFGQIIGNTVEASLKGLLIDYAKRRGLYLDQKGARKARGKKKKVTWLDIYGNCHDLDYVLEKGGTENKIGVPAAFIETAWRRYTKHSRNKAQEIQGAILPLRETYHESAPFIGTVLAGVFTEPSLQQLRSLGFSTIYYPYETVVEAFASVGIDADYDENTSDREFSERILKWEGLEEDRRRAVSQRLVDLNSDQVQDFMERLDNHNERNVLSIRVLPLHGIPTEYESIEEAIGFIQVDFRTF